MARLVKKKREKTQITDIGMKKGKGGGGLSFYETKYVALEGEFEAGSYNVPMNSWLHPCREGPGKLAIPKNPRNHETPLKSCCSPFQRGKLSPQEEKKLSKTPKPITDTAVQLSSSLDLFSIWNELKSLCSGRKIQQCIQLTSVVKRNRLFDVLCFNFLCTKNAHNYRGPLHCYMCKWCIDLQSVWKTPKFSVAKKNPEIITVYSQLSWPTQAEIERFVNVLF